jgi:hypothetical protein
MSGRNPQARINKRKRLDALFDRGGYLTVGSDGAGRPVINPETTEGDDNVARFWVSPPSPLQREMAVREAQAARARAMIEARDSSGSAQWLTVRGFISGLDADGLINYVCELDEAEYLAEARRDVLIQPEWEDFSTLRDAMRQFEEADDPTAEEWQPLIQRDKDFGDQVTVRYAELREDAMAGYKLMPREQLETKAIDRRIEQAGTSMFMAVYEEWMLYFAVRDDEDHQDLYFDSVNEIKALPMEVQEALAGKLASFITDVTEAKN